MKQRPLGFRLKDSLKSKEISKRRHWGLFCLVCGKIRCNEFGETQNCRLIARFAGNLIDSFPRRFVFIRRFRTRKRYFNLQTIEGAAKSNATRHSRGMAMKAVSAGGDNGSLELQDRLVAQARGVGKVAGGAANRSDEAFVGIQENRNLMRQGRHG